jgi:hypothetical protein
MIHRLEPTELAELAAPILVGLMAQNVGKTGPNLRTVTQLAGEAISVAVELHAAAVAEVESKREPPPKASDFADYRP